MKLKIYRQIYAAPEHVCLSLLTAELAASQLGTTSAAWLIPTGAERYLRSSERIAYIKYGSWHTDVILGKSWGVYPERLRC